MSNDLVTEALKIIKEKALARLGREQQSQVSTVFEERKFPTKFKGVYFLGQETLALSQLALGEIIGESAAMENAIQTYVNAILRCSGQTPIYGISDYGLAQRMKDAGTSDSRHC